MNFKRFHSEVWHDTPHYIHNTATDTITTLPIDLYADGTNATVGLKGNMSWTGTPTPNSPIMPEGCGERTGNLLFAPDTGTTVSVLAVSYTTNSSEFILNKNVTDNNVSSAVNCNIALDAETYSITVQGLNTAGVDLDRIYLVDSNNTIIVQNIVNNTSVQFTLTEATTIAKISFVAAASSVYNNQVVSIMLNTGSTALPYQPYGYKIPISSANATTPVYLGEVQSTRRVKKLVLDGTGNWSAGTENFYRFIDSFGEGIPYSNVICTHAQHSTINNTGKALLMKISDFSPISSVADFKTYLQQQYAADTPVTVWYVLATEETGIVNEPLRKIGDYADEVSGISIPVTAGANTISVDTTLQPSEVTATYKGWHPVADVHERDNGQWN